MNKEYIVLYCSSDGVTMVSYDTKEELENWLNSEDAQNAEFLNNTTKELPWNGYESTSYYMIIKGQVVVPTAKQVVTKYEI